MPPTGLSSARIRLLEILFELFDKQKYIRPILAPIRTRMLFGGSCTVFLVTEPVSMKSLEADEWHADLSGWEGGEMKWSKAAPVLSSHDCYWPALHVAFSQSTARALAPSGASGAGPGRAWAAPETAAMRVEHPEKVSRPDFV